MSVKEILESEKRNESNLFDIHFYMEGSFWRAYEWSAYLSHFFPCGLNDDERLRPIKRIDTDNGGYYVQVGLQSIYFK